MLNVSVSPVLARERLVLVEEKERADHASINAVDLADAGKL
jgi:hypothetical protein